MKLKYIVAKIFLLFLFICIKDSVAQGVILMPVNGSKDTTLSSCVLYDDGGPTGNHSPQCNATYTFHTTNPNSRFRIIVHAYLNYCNSGKENLTVYECGGTDCDEITYGDQFCYNYTRIYYSSGNTITVKYASDDENPSPGFMIQIDEAGCEPAENVVATLNDTNAFLITWDEANTDIHWVIDYCEGTYVNRDIVNNPNLHTVYIDTNFIIINNWNPDTVLSYNVRPACSSFPGEGIGVLGNACLCVSPQNVIRTYDADSVYFTWDNPLSYNINWYLHFWGNFFDTVTQTWSDLFDTTTQTHWSHALGCGELPDQLVLTGNCNYNPDYYPIYRSCDYYILDSLNQFLCPKINYFHYSNVSDSSVLLAWINVNDSVKDFQIGYRESQYPEDSNIYIIAHDTNVCCYYNVTGLKELTNYTFEIKSICLNGGHSCGDSINVNTSLSGCIDYLAFLSAKTDLYAGTYTKPDSWHMFGKDTIWDPILVNDSIGGILATNGDRFLAKMDTTEYDALTNGLLRCVPEGAKASVKLGNDNIGAEEEAISYDYYVDTTDKDMLVLKYAVVLEEPGHTRLNQPRFTLQILDSTGNLIDSTCCFADFYAAGDLGWNEVPGTDIIWKDWTMVGIDIAAYHGQNIKIKLTTYDCAEGGHFGYAYFTINCDNKRIYLLNRCDAVDSIWLQAPLGFEYKWTKLGETTILSTDFEVEVPVDTNIYQCLASFIGKPECNFTISTVSINVAPRALAEYIVDTCRGVVTLYNKSHLDFDSTYLIYTKQIADSMYWEYEDGTIVQGDTITRKFTQNGDYNIRLYCFLSDSYCVDTLDIPLKIDFLRNLRIEGDSSVCHGNSLRLTAVQDALRDDGFVWNTSDTASSITIVPEYGDTSYYVTLSSYDGLCSDTAYKNIKVYPAYNDTVVANICEGQVYDSLNFHESRTGVYSKRLLTEYGCDSLLTLVLTVKDTYDTTIYAYGCDTGYYDNNFDVSESGTYTQNLVSQYGCDSIIRLDFVRYDVFKDTIKAEIYKGDTFNNNGFEAYQSGIYEQTYQDIHGCDSTYVLDLKVIDFHFPNVVTPNGDGKNDVYDIHDLIDQTMFNYTCLRIYNRYGKLIFEKENIHDSNDRWDPNETNSPAGTYFYRFNAKSRTKDIDVTGVIEVLREK